MDSSNSSNLESRELFLAYYRKPSVKTRNQLVKLNLGLVKKIAYSISRQCAEPYEDLQQIGYLGLIRAIERYNPCLGSAFSSFAIPYIRGEILHYLRDKSNVMKIPRRWQDLAKKAAKIRKKYLAKNGNAPSDLDMACLLGVTIQEWLECQLACQNRLTVSLDVMVGQMLDSSVSFGETIPDIREQYLQSLEEERLHLEGAINQLEEKTKRAIEWVFLQDLSRKEVAQRIGMSPMTVTRHLKKGIAELSILLNSNNLSVSI